ncbi:LOG family protein [Aspergillus mulundensis]|uniref:Lysine decarboxylase-like protein n=1 Tax=Aspergillus mulundensis TaxID=1810919 RepID=A0A3D8T297_9EURO|nr:Uncharacterized protein DSM5745_00024 [Aspergillus mulundensis]RDW92702.1 Uncharacterized protein DSM5745_00024 [Aspergillus mulundensis]
MSEPKPAVVCVFCGATPGKDAAHLEAAHALAVEFHKNNVHLVYGGGTTGLMGEVAKTLVALSGPTAVHGIIPRALVQVKADAAARELNGAKAAERVVSSASELEQPVTEYGLTTIVPDMHTRKRLMATKVMEGGPGSGFVSLAGGFGTIEELMEMTTWNQLGIHQVGVVLLNVNGYWDGVMLWIRNGVAQGFIREKNAKIIAETTDPAMVVAMLVQYRKSEDRLLLNWEK